MTQKKVLGVIPARGGSKGIPKKNIYPLLGRPLIAYSIDEAKKSRRLTHLIVSTDCPEIAAVARQYGADVPFLRPAEFAGDSASSFSVVKHALEFLEEAKGCRYDAVVLLQPTTPLRIFQDIDGAVDKLWDSGADTVVSLNDVGAHHPMRMYFIEDGKMLNVLAEGTAMKPRQQLPTVYIRSGDIYACKRSVIDECQSLMGKNCVPQIIPVERAVNIDSNQDLVVAEYKLRKMRDVK